MPDHQWSPRSDGRPGVESHQNWPCEGDQPGADICQPLPHAFYVLLIGQGMPESLKTGEQHAWLYRYFGECQERSRELAAAKAIVEPLERLRAGEGASVTINSPNYDFHGPNEVIEVSDDWTGPLWEPKRFEGETLAECLAKAEAAKIDSLPTLLDACGILKPYTVNGVFVRIQGGAEQWYIHAEDGRYLQRDGKFHASTGGLGGPGYWPSKDHCKRFLEDLAAQ